MDHFYQQKLINEKINLQKQLAKTSKQVTELQETVRQYEQLIEELHGNQKKIDLNHNNKIDAGDFALMRKRKKKKLNEAEVKGVNIPEKIRLRGTISNKNEQTPITPARSTGRDKKPEVKHPVQYRSLGTIKEAALVRGMEAIKLRAAKRPGKKLPTPAEAAAQEKKIAVEKEMEEAGLGKLKFKRNPISEDMALTKAEHDRLNREANRHEKALSTAAWHADLEAMDKAERKFDTTMDELERKVRDTKVLHGKGGTRDPLLSAAAMRRANAQGGIFVGDNADTAIHLPATKKKKK